MSWWNTWTLQAAMESMRTESADDGQPPMPSAQVVSNVLSQSSSSNTFLKNIGIAVTSKKLETSTKKALKEQLTAKPSVHCSPSASWWTEEEECEVQDQVLVKTQKEFEEFKKYHEENNQLLRRILMLNSVGNSSPWSHELDEGVPIILSSWWLDELMSVSLCARELVLVWGCDELMSVCVHVVVMNKFM